MEIKEAIYVSEKNLTWAGAAMPSDCFKAYKLGIEAMKAIQDLRISGIKEAGLPLLGETQD